MIRKVKELLINNHNECNCENYKPLELDRDQISNRIRDNKKILKTLELIAKSNGMNILYRCTCCGQYWQESSAWNWGGKTYLFKVPETTMDDWQREQFMSPADMLIYSALMNDYFKKNKLIETDRECQKEGCNNNSIEGGVLCKRHFIENLQKVNLLPKEPSGKMFEPYRFGYEKNEK